MQLDRQVAIITGAGSGIGAAIARQFAAAGAQVVLVGRRAAALEEVRASLGGPHPARVAPADITDRAAVGALVEAVAGDYGRIDILVNNAGANVRARRVAELAAEDWERLLTVNATGAFHLAQALLPHMRARGGGLIINIVSTSGVRASVLAGAAYSAAKHALAALGRVIAQEERAHGIRVTNIHPGEVNTPILDQRPEPVSAGQRARALQPEDVAAAALFVAALPPRACVPELVITPLYQAFV